MARGEPRVAQREAACGRCAEATAASQQAHEQPIRHAPEQLRHSASGYSGGGTRHSAEGVSIAGAKRRNSKPKDKDACEMPPTREPTVDERQSMIPSVTIVAIWKRESIATRKGSLKVSYARRRGQKHSAAITWE